MSLLFLIASVLGGGKEFPSVAPSNSTRTLYIYLGHPRRAEACGLEYGSARESDKMHEVEVLHMLLGAGVFDSWLGHRPCHFCLTGWAISILQMFHF